MLTDKTILVTGGTGSLGKVLVRRLLSGELGQPRKVIVFSRDEAKQHAMRLSYQRREAATDEVIYSNLGRTLQFQIGDVCDFHSVSAALRNTDVVFHAAALKQVPTCEYFPVEAVQTNVLGAENLVRAIRLGKLPVQAVVGVSTDKACKPVSVMGMTKALQERLLVCANLDSPGTRFVCVRYGNVLASRGSVIPLFLDQIRRGGPVTVTSPQMTRFLMSLDQAVDAIYAALRDARPGEIFVPKVPTARVIDVATTLVGSRPVAVKVVGIRPGEKIHELLIAEDEVRRTVLRGNYFVIRPLLPELQTSEVREEEPLSGEYSSADHLLSIEQLRQLLAENGLLFEDSPHFDLEVVG
jgi:FlaA1/EpsC-like NDP-sugar epimerase